MARLEERPRRRPERRVRRLPPGTRLALVIFATLVILGPLAFGAVDRITQVALLALFALGLFLRPPVVHPLSTWGNRLAITLLSVLLLKEFAPAAWFGTTHWRTVLTGAFNLELPWTHNPEPARALDGLLAWLAAALWFSWVRTLASDRDCRPVLAWSLLSSGAVVTAIAFATRGMDSEAIYGLRYTPGWTGFGPFPNRNHTGDFLAMATVLGCGCAVWNGVRQRWAGLIAGILLSLVTLAGLISSQSRGALLGAGIGAAVFLGLVFVKVRSRKIIAAAFGGALALGAVTALFGSNVLDRFQSKDAGDVSNLMRVHIWQDTLQMWRDAPLFGHGLRTFPQLIGLYQTLRLEDQIILHPESSWLQWLVELGVLPVLLAGLGLALFLSRQVRAAFKSDRGFYLRAGAFGACAVLFFHAAIDVPAHRWGTLGFALAALALACPLHIDAHLPAGSRKASLVAFSLAGFWVLPFFCDWPAWSPLTVSRLVERASTQGGVSLDEMQKAAGYLPLDAQLHQTMGMRQVHIVGATAPTLWQRQYDLASVLIPGSWQLIAAQARSVATISPGLSIGYWQEALERCDLHREEVLGTGVRETLRFPSAALLWGNYVEANPALLLPYAQLVPDEQARYYYSLWWQMRALTADLSPTELDIFYGNATRWGTRSQFDDWMRERAAWKDRDSRLWASLLEQWQDHRSAFEVLASHYPEPAFPQDSPTVPRAQLEMKWRVTPKDVVNAQQLALLLHLEGDAAQSEAIIFAVAAKEYAPPWFVIKAAHLHAHHAEYADAAALLLRVSAKPQ